MGLIDLLSRNPVRAALTASNYYKESVQKLLRSKTENLDNILLSGLANRNQAPKCLNDSQKERRTQIDSVLNLHSETLLSEFADKIHIMKN